MTGTAHFSVTCRLCDTKQRMLAVRQSSLPQRCVYKTMQIAE